MEELNSGPPKTNPSSGREEDLNPGPPDSKSNAPPLGHARLPCSPRFTPESVFYTQSVMLSPRFILRSMFYTQSVVCSPQFTFYTDRVNRRKLFRRCARRRASIAKTRTIVMFKNTNRLWGNSYWALFHFRSILTFFNAFISKEIYGNADKAYTFLSKF